MTHKVLKSCRSKMATWAHDVCDVHGASSLYIKICWQSSFIYYMYNMYMYNFLLGGCGESTPTSQKFARSNLLYAVLFSFFLSNILENYKLTSMAYWWRCWTPNPGVSWSKPLGSSMVDSAFHPSEFDKMSTRNFCELSIVK